LVETVARLPVRLHQVTSRPNYLTGSGLVSIARVRLEKLRLRLRQQVKIGPDTVDYVGEGWIILELDGDEWHDPVKDRIRTNRLVRAGYTVLRFGLKEVLDDWPTALETILAALRMQRAAS